MKKYNYNLMESEAEKRLQKNKITLSTYGDILYCLLDIFTSNSGTAETIIKTTADFFTEYGAKITPCGIGYKIEF